MSFLAAAALLIALEEILHAMGKGERGAYGGLESLRGDGGASWARPLRILRTVQLVSLGVLFVFITGEVGPCVLGTVPGRLAGLVMLLQLARMLNRRVVGNWSVLSSTSILQIVLLLVIPLTGTLRGGSCPGENWAWELGPLALLMMLSLSVPFMVTYAARLWSREGSSLFNDLPPLSFSESWMKRIVGASIAVAAVSAASTVLFAVNGDIPTHVPAFQVTLLLLLLAARRLFASRARLHHPGAMLLVAVSWVSGMVVTLTSV